VLKHGPAKPASPPAATLQHGARRFKLGYRPGLTVFGTNPLAPPDELPQVPITLTLVGGLVRHLGSLELTVTAITVLKPFRPWVA